MSKITNNVRLNPVWHRMLYSCTHIATVGVKGLNWCQWIRLTPHQWRHCHQSPPPILCKHTYTSRDRPVRRQHRRHKYSWRLWPTETLQTGIHCQTTARRWLSICEHFWRDLETHLFIYLFIYKLRTQCHTVIAETVQNNNRHWRRPTQVFIYLMFTGITRVKITSPCH